MAPFLGGKWPLRALASSRAPAPKGAVTLPRSDWAGQAQTYMGPPVGATLGLSRAGRSAQPLPRSGCCLLVSPRGAINPPNPPSRGE